MFNGKIKYFAIDLIQIIIIYAIILPNWNPNINEWLPQRWISNVEGNSIHVGWWSVLFLPSLLPILHFLYHVVYTEPYRVFLTKHESKIQGLTFCSSALLVVLVGLRGIRLIITKENPSLLIAGIELEFMMLFLLGVTFYLKRKNGDDAKKMSTDEKWSFGEESREIISIIRTLTWEQQRKNDWERRIKNIWEEETLYNQNGSFKMSEI